MYKQLKYCVLIMASIWSLSISAQEQSPASQIPDGIFCKDDDFLWVINEDTLKNGETYYLCLNDTLDNKLVYIIPAHNIPYDSVKYETSPYFIENVIPIPGSLFKLYFLTKFQKNCIELKASVYLNGNKKKYDLNVKREKIEVNIDVPKNAYAYDDNKIKEYWPSLTPKPKTPWQYIPIGDHVNATIKTKAWKGKNIEMTSPSITSVSPNKFQSKSQAISINALDEVGDISSIVKAGCMDSLLHIMSSYKKVDTIDFFVLCHQADDIQVNFGKVASDTTVCIEAGLNRRIDDEQYYKARNDTVITLNGRKVVVSGKDSICTASVKSVSSFCGKLPNVANLVQQCNEVYSPIGVQFVIGEVDTIKFFWDGDDDGFLKKIGEQNEIHINLFTKLVNNNRVDPNRTKVLLVNKILPDDNAQIGTTVNGRASGLNVNSLALRETSDGYTLAHEIGHAKYGLKHPDIDTTHLNDRFNGEIPPENLPLSPPFNHPDNNNFMFSTNSGRTNNIRAYQWKRILFGTFN